VKHRPGSQARWVPVEAESFYHLASVRLVDQPCQGTACFVARHRAPDWAGVEASSPRLYCVGCCYAAPATAACQVQPRVEVATSTPVVLERIASGVPATLAAYTAQRGYEAFEQAIAMDPARIVTEVERSGLRGRGGAGFATGRKWRTVRSQPGAGKYVVAAATARRCSPSRSPTAYQPASCSPPSATPESPSTRSREPTETPTPTPPSTR